MGKINRGQGAGVRGQGKAKILLCLLLAGLFALLAQGQAQAGTYTVKQDGTGDFTERKCVSFMTRKFTE